MFVASVVIIIYLDGLQISCKEYKIFKDDYNHHVLELTELTSLLQKMEIAQQIRFWVLYEV